jgi:O-antigen biosynthesis protein
VRPAARPLRWAIKTCAPDVAERHQWGDWHFAVSLARALERQGAHVTVDCRRAWYRPTAHLDDVVLSLRGTRRYEPNPQHCNLTWVISHPEWVTADELGVLDHVLVASPGLAERLARRVPHVPVEPLLQCTDSEVFFPDPDPELAEEVLFVGNSRGQLRTVIRDALAAGLRPAIHGEGWEGLVPDELIRSTHVPNHELRRHYASARVVLNDHWEDMREHGIVSNRIFDALACGATVVTDRIEGLPPAPEGRCAPTRMHRTCAGSSRSWSPARVGAPPRGRRWTSTPSTPGPDGSWRSPSSMVGTATEAGERQ